MNIQTGVCSGIVCGGWEVKALSEIIHTALTWMFSEALFK